MNRICTIIAVNYLPQAMALLDSIRKVYPDIEFWVLITDSQTKEVPFLSSAKVLLPEDLEIPATWLQEMRSYYDQVELATSLKPFLLNTLLTEEVTTVTYLDPDILLFDKLTEGFDAAEEFGIALVPHRLTPANILDPEFLELELHRYGIFNLGYICVGHKAQAMLQWWEERLRWYCTRFPNGVVFTDQKWMNFVPALFDFKVVKNFGYDFAPWNFNERPLSKINEVYFAGESTLVFIHFSQMSGGLAAGIGTDLWQKAFNSSDHDTESFELISALTASYSSTLINHKEETSLWAKENTRPNLPKFHGFHRRESMIQESIDKERGDSRRRLGSSKRGKLFIHGSIIARKIERSSTLNGARAGFREDCQRLAMKLRGIFKWPQG